MKLVWPTHAFRGQEQFMNRHQMVCVIKLSDLVSIYNHVYTVLYTRTSQHFQNTTWYTLLLFFLGGGSLTLEGSGSYLSCGRCSWPLEMPLQGADATESGVMNQTPPEPPSPRITHSTQKHDRIISGCGVSPWNESKGEDVLPTFKGILHQWRTLQVHKWCSAWAL